MKALLEVNIEKHGDCLGAWGLMQFLPLKFVHPEFPAGASGVFCVPPGSSEVMLDWSFYSRKLWAGFILFLCVAFFPSLFLQFGKQKLSYDVTFRPLEKLFGCFFFFSQFDHLFIYY